MRNFPNKSQNAVYDAQRALRIAADLIRYPADPPGYPERVRELEAEGLCTSDAQGVADVEFAKTVSSDFSAPGRSNT